MRLVFWKEKAVLYYRKHGLWKSAKQVCIKIKEGMFPEPDVVYYANLIPLKSRNLPVQNEIRVVERKTADQLTPDEKSTLFDQIGRNLIGPQLAERFGRGASAWFVYYKDQFAGMVWTLVGDTVEPFYYFLTPEDVHVFNNVIFPEYRGQGINPVLIETVLHDLSERGLVRAYIETRVSNLAEQKSLAKTSFQPMGTAQKKIRRNRRITFWSSLVPYLNKD